MMLVVRWILELIVMASLVAGALKLYEDWGTIEPPVWRWIILAYQSVLLANAAALLWAITESREITPFTWGLMASYSFLFATLMIPLVLHRFPRAPSRPGGTLT